MAEETEDKHNHGNIIPINLEDEMRSAYIDYSMSVIVSRALPDVRDGLKPVHRRVLYGMQDLGVSYNKAYKKSARIVGEVLGKYHPHGDTSVYDAMVRMAQPWSLRYPLVDGQGNFGSVDGDSPAAMRYTEARLKRIADELLGDINKNTVDFQPNFDDSLEEPTVLPAKIPNLLINGTTGIAVGMATNMAPHNLSDVVDATVAYIDNRDITITELAAIVKAPDFPTGGTIYGMTGVKSGYETGRGRVVIRATASFETSKTGREQIIVTEIPYMVNKANMIEKTAALINEKKIEGIAEIRDESDRDGMRVVYDLKRDAVPNVVLNNLYKYTQLQSSFGINNVCLVHGRPQTLNLKDLIHYFVEHRHEVVIRRTRFELDEAEKRAHILEGLIIASDNIDEVIAIIKAAKSPEQAREDLIVRFSLSDLQSRAIVEMRLRQLTGLEQDKLRNEYAEVMALIERLREILANESVRMDIIKKELVEVKERYGDARRTAIVYAADDISMEDMIADEDMVITISEAGYIKRSAITEYKTQSRGGRGSRGVKMKEDDYTKHLFVANTHSYLLLFTEKGKVFWVKVYEIPEGGKTTKGRSLSNVINIEQDDTVRAVINVNNLSDADYINNNFVVMCTKKGTVKKTSIEAFSRPRANGITAIGINEGDQLLNVKLCGHNDEIVMALKSGRSIRFNESNVRAMGRTASGVRGIRLASDEDEVVGLATIQNENQSLLVVSEKGYGKRTSVAQYRITKRGGKGVRPLNVTEKTGLLVGILDVEDTDDLMIINKSGLTIRLAVKTIREIGRVSQGVKLIKISDTDAITSIAKIKMLEEETEELSEEELEAMKSVLASDEEAEELEPINEDEAEEDDADAEEGEADAPDAE